MSQEGTTEPHTETAVDTEATERSVSEILSEQADNLKYISLIFAVVGVGFGLTGGFGSRFIMDGESELLGAFFMISVFTVMFLTGPILGAITGLQIDRRITDTRESIITAFAGGFAGYLAMTIIGSILAIVLLPSNGESSGGGGGGPDFGEIGSGESHECVDFDR